MFYSKSYFPGRVRVAEEKEIKLKVPETLVCKVYTLDVLLHAERQKKSLLKNTYYDTEELFLSSKKAALRIREFDGVFIQTLKTQGTSIDGFHVRNEWEWDIDKPELVLGKLEEIETIDLDLPSGNELLPIFTTDFCREQWLLSMNEGRDLVEIAFDQGRVMTRSKSGQKREDSICELELELKQGSETALKSLAQDLMAQLPELVPYDVSKAQRGYQLFLDEVGA